jgi:hypothetical protein
MRLTKHNKRKIDRELEAAPALPLGRRVFLSVFSSVFSVFSDDVFFSVFSSPSS